MKSVACIFGIFFICSVCLASWQFDVIDGGPQIVPENQLRFDGQGQLCMTTYDVFGHSLYFAWKVNDVWQIEMVDGRDDTGFYNDLRFDNQGQPHIVYSSQKDNSGKPMYAFRDQTGWHREQIDIEGGNIQHTSLGLADDGTVHCVFFDDSGTGVLKYAKKGTSGWATEILDTAGVKAAIAMNPDGDPVVFYTDVNGFLRIAEYSVNGWNISILLDSVSIVDQPVLDINESGLCHSLIHDELSHSLYWLGYEPESQDLMMRQICQETRISDYASLALDKYGQPHILCYYYNILYYTCQLPQGSWLTEEVDYGSVGSTIFTSIAVDAKDEIHLTYFSYIMDWYTYAHGTICNLNKNQILEYPIFGEFSSMTTDSANNAHVIYFNEHDGSIKYASNIIGKWVSQNVSSASVNGLNCLDIEVDINQTPYVCYLSSDQQQQLRFSVKDTDAWDTETFGNAWSVNQCDMALDSNSNVYIVITTMDTQDLVLLSRIDGIWSSSILDNNVDNPAFPAVTIDSENMVHISYQKNQSLLYLYNETVLTAISELGSEATIHTMQTDVSNHPHFAFFHSGSSSLKYAHFDENGWEVESICSGIQAGGNVSLEVTRDEKPHLIFRNPATNHLKYAVKEEGYWELSTISSNIQSGSLDIEFSIDDSINIVFFNGMPMYAVTPYTPKTDLGCSIFMPSENYYPGDICFCEVKLTNPTGINHENLALFFILHLYDCYFYYPSFTMFDFINVDLPTGEITIITVPEFIWPENSGTYNDVRAFAILTDPEITKIVGEIDVFEFAYSEQ
ncbi:hypothetical protein K8T06_17300 [bacterium]|nr:hypothetical protein [bacterium]